MNEFTDAAGTGGRGMTVFGIILIVLGILCLFAPVMTGLSIVTFIGVMVLIAGIVRMIWAFRAQSLGRGLLRFVIGLLTLLCGAVLVGNPLFASGVLTVLLAIYFIVDGIFEVVAGVRLRPAFGSGWMILGGIVSILLGLIIWRQFPLSGVWAIGVLLGIKLVLAGLIMIRGGSALRSLAK